LSPGGSGYFTCVQNMNLVTNKLKSGGLHEKLVVATWNLGKNLSIYCLRIQTKEKLLGNNTICFSTELSSRNL